MEDGDLSQGHWRKQDDDDDEDDDDGEVEEKEDEDDEEEARDEFGRRLFTVRTILS